VRQARGQLSRSREELESARDLLDKRSQERRRRRRRRGTCQTSEGEGGGGRAWAEVCCPSRPVRLFRSARGAAPVSQAGRLRLPRARAEMGCVLASLLPAHVRPAPDGTRPHTESTQRGDGAEVRDGRRGDAAQPVRGHRGAQQRRPPPPPHPSRRSDGPCLCLPPSLRVATRGLQEDGHAPPADVFEPGAVLNGALALCEDTPERAEALAALDVLDEREGDLEVGRLLGRAVHLDRGEGRGRGGPRVGRPLAAPKERERGIGFGGRPSVEG
jgi:hypothetical protein